MRERILFAYQVVLLVGFIVFSAVVLAATQGVGRPFRDSSAVSAR
jgi:hypothetical protein